MTRADLEQVYKALNILKTYGLGLLWLPGQASWINGRILACKATALVKHDRCLNGESMERWS